MSTKTNVTGGFDATVCYDAFPTLIRGCAFDAQWEFDMPTIIYFPFFKYGDGGNSGHLYQMVENLCIDLVVEGSVDFAAMRAEVEHECKWRRWSMRGFAKRKEAWHVEFAVRWYNADGQTEFDLDQTREQRGPFKSS